MLLRLPVFLVSLLSFVSLPAVVAAQGASATLDSDEPPSDQSVSEAPKPKEAPSHGTAEGASVTPPEPAAAPAATLPNEPKAPNDEWRTEVHGYFRAPMSLGISSRPNPDTPNGPAKTQISYGPNRVVDWSYYSFAYTRLQEQDWAEITFHMKKKHADAAVGWMGYWLSAAGFRNPDAAGVPGVASLTLDTDFGKGDVKPNIALQMGAWWPGFGYFEKYDTFTLGRFRQLGEQVKVRVPVNADLAFEFVHGFGTDRDGAFSYGTAQNSPLYASRVGADLLTYLNARVQYKKYVDIGVHFNTEWTRDPYLSADADPTAGKAYSQVADARMSVFGAEANLSASKAGRLWISPSYIKVKNGWALGNTGGTEVMHAQGGLGIATNYLGWNNDPQGSTGSGSMFNLGFLYENTLANIQGKTSEDTPHDVRLNIFGLLADASLDLPATAALEAPGTQVNQNTIKQFKYGADVTVKALDWLSVMLRGDTVNYNIGHPGYIFSAITTRLAVSTHYLSSESIYLQYSRYIYGDNTVLGGQWPWHAPIVAGSDVIQSGTYVFKKPDQDVIKLQATVTF